MINLDSLEEIKKIDKSGLRSSLKLFSDEIKQSWEEMKNIKISKGHSQAKNVVIAGMGGSALGGRIIDSLTPERSRTPIEIFTEYTLPNYVNRETLVIVSSYSGNTEEALSDAQEAISRKAQIVGITTGGKLEKLLKKHKLPVYLINPKYNPSGQPRMALGYSIGAILSLLARCQYIDIRDDAMAEVFISIENHQKNYGLKSATKTNLAKMFAQRLYRKIPVLVASEHLVGSAHAVKNEINENAKAFSVIFDIPELNHHLMEGLKHPYFLKKDLNFLFFESSLYTDRVQKRYPITQNVVEKNGVQSIKYQASGKNKLEQIFEVLTFGSYLSFYLAMLYQEDPQPIPWVDYFKEQLVKA